MRARRARPDDVAWLHGLIARYAAEGFLLPRSEEEIRAHIGHFLLLAERDAGGERRLGCVALEPYSAGLAEVRSLAVDPEVRGRGLGARLLQAALAAARRRRIARVFAVTHAPGLFARQGFAATTRWALPEKIARDCRTCRKARACQLFAVVAVVCPERVTLPVLESPAKPAPAL